MEQNDRSTRKRPLSVPSAHPKSKRRWWCQTKVLPADTAVQGGVKSEAFRAHTDLDRWPCARDGRLITVGSDYSGLDSVAVALKQMGLGGRVQCKL